MKKINSDITEFSDSELEIISRIKNDPVPGVFRDDMKKVCQTAASYYTEKQSIRSIEFWKVVFSCLTVNSAFFWIFSAFLLGSYALAFAVITKYDAEPFAFMTAFAPVPILAFAVRELHYRDPGLVQLEKVCKYSPDKIYFARLWTGMIFNALFTALAEAAAFHGYENLLRLYLCSFTAMFFVGAAALILMSFFDSVLPLSLTTAFWVMAAAYLLCQSEILEAVMKVSLMSFTAVLALGIAAFAAAAVKTTSEIYSREV